MIVAKRKEVDDIINNIKDMKNVLVVGCNGCVGIHKMGGEKQAEELASLLKLSKDYKGEAADTTVIRQCDPSIIKEALAEEAPEYDAVLSIACGAGVQVLADVLDETPVFPAMDTTFIGIEDRESAMLYERCVACGNCILDQTGGICPVTRCPKSDMNGPCGGLYNGKCETDRNRDCAWVLIYNKLNKTGQLDLNRKIKAPKDFSKRTHPRAQEV